VQVKLVEAAPFKGGLRFEMVSDGRAGKPLKQRGDAGKRKKFKRK
jgi:ribonuclease R